MNAFNVSYGLRELTDRYSDAVNARDWASYSDCWTHDAVWDLGPPVNLLKTGRDVILEEVKRAVGAMDLFVQMPHAFHLLEANEERARGRVTVNEIGRIRESERALLDGAEGMSILAVYTDDFLRCPDGQWRFSRRAYRVQLFDGRAPQGLLMTAR